MIEVKFYAFAKKRNSTKIPGASNSPLTFNCELKEPCSILAPSITINNGSAWNPSSYNYAFIVAFFRYYYVTNWTYYGGLWHADLAVDVLASHKGSIMLSTGYVARASKRYNGNISDTLFPATSEVETHVSYLENTWQTQFNAGFYVVGIINNDADSIGAVSYYAFTPAQFSALKSFLLGDTTWTGILSTNPDIGDNLYKSLFNPFQYISSVNWFPLTFNTDWGTLLNKLKFGWWELDPLACYRLTTYEYQSSIYAEISVPYHPQAQERGIYLNTSPFTTYRLVFPPFGEFELDGSLFNGNGSYTSETGPYYLPYRICVDFISGSGLLELYVSMGAENQATLLVAQSTVAVPIQIAQITSNKWGEIRNTGETGAAILGSALSGSASGVISSALTGVYNAIESKIPHSQQQGNNGSLAAYRTTPRLEAIYHIMADDTNTDRGRPLCEEVLLGSLSPGYILTIGSHVEIAGMEEEISEINDYLDGGVFLE